MGHVSSLEPISTALYFELTLLVVTHTKLIFFWPFSIVTY